MTMKPLAAALICLPLLAGCATPYSEAPLATNFPTSKQPKLQAAAHWNAIAQDVAHQIAGGLQEKRPLYVNPPTAGTIFERAFTNQLISALVAEGQAVVKHPDGALSVDLDTQTVRFSPHRPQYRHAGTATALTAGVWALHDAEATAGAVLLAGVAAADAYAWFRSEFATGDTPQTEVIITASVGDTHRFLVRSTSVYYVADTDGMLYENPPAVRTKGMGVTGQ